ncbi:MAG: sulfatase-like hydrolase/transferase [Cyclobacteriaceae bacterium]
MRSRTKYCLLLIVLIIQASYSLELKGQNNLKPNVIMISVDDMNDWVSPLGNAQAITPNMDRLAEKGVTFKNAHAPAVFCAPSRTSIWTGLHASTTGCYNTEVYHYDYPDLVPMQKAFQDNDYDTYGAGKLFHHRGGYVDLRGWNEFHSESQEMRDDGWEMNSYYYDYAPTPTTIPHSPYYAQSSTRTFKKSAGFLEYGPIPNEKEDDMVDAIRTDWIAEQLKKDHDKPFFMALGLYTPHYPNYAPQKYFDLYDANHLTPPDFDPEDLNDLPAAIKQQYTNRSRIRAEMVGYGALNDAIHAYYASISFADAMLGRVLDALEDSPYKDNTIILLWSDQGYHLGEKGQWGKHTLWQRTTQVPFIWAGPEIAANKSSSSTVSLIDIYPTLVDVCGLTVDTPLEGVSITNLLQQPEIEVPRNVYVPFDEPDAYAIINDKWRFIRYADGGEELYNLKDDPQELTNLAGRNDQTETKKYLGNYAPTLFAPVATQKNDLRMRITNDGYYYESKDGSQPIGNLQVPLYDPPPFDVAVLGVDTPENYRVYPNPSSGKFTIEIPQKSADLPFVVYNQMGKMIESGIFTDHHSILDLNSQPRGIYFLELMEKRQSKTIKINFL